MMQVTLLAALLLLTACQSASMTDVVGEPACDSVPVPPAVVPDSAVRRQTRVVVDRLAEVNQPATDGALGRNRQAYFHVRFQQGTSAIADYATAYRSRSAAESLLRTLDYSLARQQPAGDFELVVPANLAYLGTPAPGDLASGTSFFLSSAGWALVLTQRDPWWLAQADLQADLAAQQPNWRRAADWLATTADVLRQVDAAAPNRLLYNAVAYYSLGEYLNDNSLRELGRDFAQRALAQVHPDGFFIEGGGWDTSYNGVCLAVGLWMCLLLPANDPLRSALWQAISDAAAWQSSRILPSGEISTAGNTRVYDGGESFLGEEKQVAVTSTWEAFHWLGSVGESACYTQLANRIEAHYR